MEPRVQEALQFIEDFPDAKISTIAKQFGVSRAKLRRRLNGAQPKKGRPAMNTKLLKAEEIALCRYIDRLDGINLAVRVEFITSAANHILEARTSTSQATIPTVGINWTPRFIKRYGYQKKIQNGRLDLRHRARVSRRTALSR